MTVYVISCNYMASSSANIMPERVQLMSTHQLLVSVISPLGSRHSQPYVKIVTTIKIPKITRNDKIAHALLIYLTVGGEHNLCTSPTPIIIPTLLRRYTKPYVTGMVSEATANGKINAKHKNKHTRPGRFCLSNSESTHEQDSCIDETILGQRDGDLSDTDPIPPRFAPNITQLEPRVNLVLAQV